MRAVAALSVAVLVATGSAADEARYRLSAALAARVAVGVSSQRVIAVEPSGDEAILTVHQSLQAFPSDPSYPLDGPRELGDPDTLAVADGFEAPWGLVRWASESRSALEVVGRVVELVSTRIVNDDGDRGPQDAATVLVRRRGRCSGRTNLAVGTLRALGLPARAVHGILVGSEGSGWHRWGEVWLGPLGWVEFDPGASVGAVSVRYIPFIGAGDGLALPDLRIEELNDRGWLSLPRSASLRVVPVGGVTVRCAAVGRATASLTGSDGTMWVRRGDGDLLFSRLLPGAYRLQWELATGARGAANVTLAGDREVRVELKPRLTLR